MDTVLPNEIELSDMSDLSSFSLNELENYALLYLSTEKWHRRKHSQKVDNISVLVKKERELLSERQLTDYYNKLLDFYRKTKKGENGVKKKIQRLSKKQEEKLTNDEYAVYLKQLRQKDDVAKINNLHLSTRRKIAPLLRVILMMSTVFTGIRIEKLNCKLPETNGRPVIFVFTHVGKDDQIVFSRVIKDHYTILSGDYESLHNNVEGIICKMNGILFFDMRSKKERAEIENRVESILRVGDNIFCSMEAAWNLSPNVPVHELFPGMIRSAIRTKAVIIPVGIERFSKKLFGINIGSSFFDPMTYVGRFGSEREMLDAARDDLRVQMADIKMQLYFDDRIFPQINSTRDKIGNYEKYNKEFKKDILQEWTFTEDVIREKAYRNRNAPEEVFGYVIEKYSKLKLYYAVMNNTTLSAWIRDQARENFKNLLVKLVLDVKNPIFPNTIHNILTENLNKWNQGLESKKTVGCISQVEL